MMIWSLFLVSYPKVMPSRSLRGGSRDSFHGRSWSVTGQLNVSTVGFQKKDRYRESDVWAANFWSSNSGFLLFICGSLFNAYVVFVDHSFNNEFYDNEIMFNRFLVGFRYVWLEFLAASWWQSDPANHRKKKVWNRFASGEKLSHQRISSIGPPWALHPWWIAFTNIDWSRTRHCQVSCFREETWLFVKRWHRALLVYLKKCS